MPELVWCSSGIFFKQVNKVISVFYTDCISDFVNAVGCSYQKFFGGRDTLTVQIL